MIMNLDFRMGAVTIGLVGLLFVTFHLQAHTAPHLEPIPGGVRSDTIPVTELLAPVLLNPDFECTEGYDPVLDNAGKQVFIPRHWTLVNINGAPMIHSARIFYAKSCEGSAHVEKINGIDSMVIRAEDLETPPEPGKPFDVAIYQPISATVGGAYSLSGWALSLCGGSAVPNDCPSDYYMSKMLGIDPTGGTDPLASTVIWTENRRNFIENEQRIGWQNLSVVAVTQAPTITIFARVNSPFRWHGNHAFVDVLSVVRSPTATLTVPATVTGTQVTLQWDGLQSPDVAAIPKGTYQLLIDVQYRHQAATEWVDFQNGYVGPGSATLTVACTDTTYEFRVRARAQQPPAPPEGAWPNHRYEGIWSALIPVQVLSPQINGVNEPVAEPDPFQLYLPVITSQKIC